MADTEKAPQQQPQQQQQQQQDQQTQPLQAKAAKQKQVIGKCYRHLIVARQSFTKSTWSLKRRIIFRNTFIYLKRLLRNSQEIIWKYAH